MKKNRILLPILIAAALTMSACTGSAADTAKAASESTEAVEMTEVDESTEAVEMTEVADGTEVAEESEAPDVTEESESSEATDGTEVADGTEVSDGTEAADGTDFHLADGIYTVDFNTDSSMFHTSEAHEGKGILTVKDGQMTIHVSLQSKKILNLFPGTAEDAGKDGAVLLEPTIDKVTYSDGLSEEVHGFDIPVPYLEAEFDCALIGTKEKWYDHKVSVSNPVPGDCLNGAGTEIVLVEGLEYTMEVTLEGGSGKASVESPATIYVQDGIVMARITWSSSYYDYMLVGTEQYLPVNTEGNSVFEIPVAVFDQAFPVSADTVAMSQPHLIDYTLTFDSGSLTEKQ